jgi:hypothetical protein
LMPDVKFKILAPLAVVSLAESQAAHEFIT